MLKNILICAIAAIPLAGCDINLSALRPIKWATVDVSKIKQSVGDKFKSEHPYPDSINQNFEEAQRESGKLRQQISSITQTNTLKCREAVIESSNINSPTPGSKKGSTAPAAVAFPEPADMRQLQNSSKYQECILAAQNDPLVADLQEKAAKFQTMFNARQKHDQEVTKKLNAYISEAIGNYAASNSFELVISRSEREVLYNKNQTEFDITGAVLGVINSKTGK